MSILAEERIIPVTPPIIKREINPKVQTEVLESLTFPPKRVLTHLKILTPVGIAIIIVAALK